MVLNKAQVEPEAGKESTKHGPYKQCPPCDLAALDDAYHFPLQCTALQNEREHLFVDKMNIHWSGIVALDSECDVLALLLGKMKHGLPMQHVENIRLVLVCIMCADKI